MERASRWGGAKRPAEFGTAGRRKRAAVHEPAFDPANRAFVEFRWAAGAALAMLAAAREPESVPFRRRRRAHSWRRHCFVHSGEFKARQSLLRQQIHGGIRAKRENPTTMPRQSIVDLHDD